MSNISGARIKNIRENKKLKQVELCAALDTDFGIKLDRASLSEIENKKRGVKDFELDAIATILDVDPTWLLRG